MTAIRVNITTRVNKQGIERVERNGKPHWKMTSYTLPFDVVMNGGLYPRREIEASYKTLNATLAPLGHPVVNGNYVSAFSPEGINGHHIGAWNENPRIEGNRVAVDKLVDVEMAQRSPGGQELLNRLIAIENGGAEAIHTSVGVMLEELPAPEGAGYDWVAKIHSIDHDAILLDEPGAATPEQGVGLMVNADKATAPKPRNNAGALVGVSYGQRSALLDLAVRTRWPETEDTYAWVTDFTDSQVVVRFNGGVAEIYGYTLENGKITISDTGTAVVKQESWMAIAANRVKEFFNPQARPAANEKDVQMTPEEKAELAQMVANATAAAVKPVTEQLTQLQANHDALAKQIAAPGEAAAATKRADVAKVYGEIVANSLQGAALDEMHAKLGTVAALAGNSATGAKDSAQDFSQIPE